MIIEIKDNKTLEEIANEFSTYYPYLKIEFYSRSHHWQEGSEPKDILPKGKTIGEVRTVHEPGMLEIHGWHKTGMIEQEFRRLFGLNIQILRCEANEWIQTVGTDELTLKEQNEIGRNATLQYMGGSERWNEKEKLL